MSRRIYTRRAVSRGQGVFSHQITITSMAGVGGTTLYNRLNRTLGDKFEFATAGGIFRKRGKDLGFQDIESFVIHNNAHPEEGHDEWCDDQQRKLGKRNRVVIEGRLSHIFLPHAFRVLLVCPLHVRAQRRHEDTKGSTFEGELIKMLKRDVRDSERYDTLYPGWFWQHKDFDLVVNTAFNSDRETEKRVLEGHEKWWWHQKKKNR